MSTIDALIAEELRRAGAGPQQPDPLDAMIAAELENARRMQVAQQPRPDRNLDEPYAQPPEVSAINPDLVPLPPGPAIDAGLPASNIGGPLGRPQLGVPNQPGVRISPVRQTVDVGFAPGDAMGITGPLGSPSVGEMPLATLPPRVVPDTMGGVAAGLQTFARVAQNQPGTPDRSIVGEMAARAVRGGMSQIGAAGGTLQGIGDAAGLGIVSDYGRAVSAASDIGVEGYRPSGGSPYSVRNIAGTIAEAGARLPAQIGAGLLGGPLGFMAAAGGEVYGDTYRESVKWQTERGVPEETAKEVAQLEALGAGAVTAATAAIPGIAILQKLPGGRGAMGWISRNVGARILAAGTAEGAQEIAEGLGQEALKQYVRGDDQAFNDEFWYTLPLQGIAGFGAGGAARGAMEIAQRGGRSSQQVNAAQGADATQTAELDAAVEAEEARAQGPQQQVQDQQGGAQVAGVEGSEQATAAYSPEAFEALERIEREAAARLRGEVADGRGDPTQERDLADGLGEQQPGPDARGVRAADAADVQPVETGVPPVVGDEGAPAGDQPGDVDVAPDYAAMPYADLRKLAKERGLPAGGTKAAIIGRLVEADSAGTEPPASSSLPARTLSTESATSPATQQATPAPSLDPRTRSRPASPAPATPPATPSPTPAGTAPAVAPSPSLSQDRPVPQAQSGARPAQRPEVLRATEAAPVPAERAPVQSPEPQGPRPSVAPPAQSPDPASTARTPRPDAPQQPAPSQPSAPPTTVEGSSASPESTAPSIGQRAETYLDRVENEARARMQRASIKRGRNTGSSIIGNQIRDLGIIAAARAIKAGIRGGRALTKLVNDTIAEYKGKVNPREVRQFTARVLKEADHNADNFDRAVGEITRPTKRRTPKAQIRETTGQADTSAAVNTTEAKALKGQMSRVQSAAREAFKAGARDGAERTRLEAEGLARKLRAQLEGARATAKLERNAARKASAAAERAEIKLATVEGIQAEAVRLIQENAPLRIRGKYLAAVRDAKTPYKLARLLDRVVKDTAAWEARQSLVRAERRSKGKLERRTLDPENLADYDAARGVIAQAKAALNPEKIGSLSVDELLILRAELDGARNAITAAIFEQKTRDKVRIKGELVEAASIRDQITTSLQSQSEIEAEDRPAAREPSWFTRQLRERTNWESIMKLVDGFKPGAAMRLFHQVLRGRRRSLEIDHEFRDQMAEIVTRNGFKSMGEFMARVSGTLGDGAQQFVDVAVGGFERLTMGQALYIYASSTDRDFMSRLRAGQPFQFGDARTDETFKLTEADLYAVEQAIPANLRRIVDESKLAYDQHFFDRLSNVNKRLKGYHLEKVPGYFGVKLNRDFSEQRGVPTNWRGNYIRAMEEAGYMQQRVGPSKTPVLIGDFGVDMMMRSRSSATLIGKAETVKLLQQTLLHPDVVPTITRKLGRSTVERLKRRLAMFSGGEIYNADERLMRKLLSNWSRSKTQLWVWTWIRNGVAGTSRIMNELGIVDVARAGVMPSWGAWQELRRFAPELRERWDAGGIGAFYDPTGMNVGEAGFKDAATASLHESARLMLAGLTLNKGQAGRAAEGLGKAWGKMLDAMTIGNYFDAMPAIVAYKHFLRKAPPNLQGDARKKWAARHATRLFERTANTASIEYANDIQLKARTNLLLASLVPFTGDVAKAQSMIYQSFGEDWKKGVRTLLVLGFGSLLSAAVSGLRDVVLAQEERALHSFGRRMAQEVGSLVPGGSLVGSGAGRIYDTFVAERRYNDTSVVDVPLAEIFNDFAKVVEAFVSAIQKADKPRRRRVATATDEMLRGLEETLNLAGAVTGLPTHYYQEVKRAIVNWSE